MTRPPARGMRPPEPTRIGLLGGECTGKSTLAGALAQDLGGCLVTERLRAFVEAAGRPPRRDEQASIMREQQTLEDAIASTCPTGIVVADPAVLMTAIYSIVYFDDDSLVDAAVESARAYHLMLWCGTDLPWVPDGVQRDGPEYRELEHAVIGDLVTTRLRPAGIDVVLIEGTPEERREAVRLAWQPRALQPPT